MKNKKIENIANILIIDDDEELGFMLQDFFLDMMLILMRYLFQIRIGDQIVLLWDI